MFKAFRVAQFMKARRRKSPRVHQWISEHTKCSTLVPVGYYSVLTRNEAVTLATIHAQSLSRVQLFATPWTVTCQAPLSMGFSRQEYWSGLPCLPPGHLPNPGIEPKSLKSPALVGGFFTSCTTWEAHKHSISTVVTKTKYM